MKKWSENEVFSGLNDARCMFFVSASSWEWSCYAKCGWKASFWGPKNLEIQWNLSQKWKYSRNRSRIELFELWLMESPWFFSAILTMIVVFSQTLLNDELWRSRFFIKFTYGRVYFVCWNMKKYENICPEKSFNIIFLTGCWLPGPI